MNYILLAILHFNLFDSIKILQIIKTVIKINYNISTILTMKACGSFPYAVTQG